MRSKNASLILTCGFPELFFLCTVIGRKKNHNPVRTPKWPPRLIFAGTCADMWLHVMRHAANMWACKQAMRARLCAGSFFDYSVAVGFAILCSQRWILVNINASTVAFIEIWGNCPCLLTRLGSGMITVGTATFWLHLLISSSCDR